MSTLSLLSRGNAKVIKTTQERIEIRFEPQDYFNWRSHHDFQLRRFLNGKCASHNYWEIPTHKTYSTKKGPLVLYSEDLALPASAWNLSQDKHGHRSHRYKRKKFKIELSTLLDLSGAILSYGRKQNGHIDSNWQPYLHFLNKEDIQYNRQIRPGYSPKRYLTRLLHTWDPNYLYKLQQTGSLRDSVQLQQLASYLGENGGRHPDLSSTPLKYQRLPAFTFLPQWTNTNDFTNSGRCTPVEEETGNEEELGAYGEILEVNGKHSTVTLSGTGAFRKSSPERTKSHATQSSWKPKEQYNSHMQRETKYSQKKEDDTISNRTDYYEKPPVPLEVTFGKDNSSHSNQKSHTTFYGGHFTGQRKYPYGKQEPWRLYNENLEHLPEGSFLPPISQPVGPESEVKETLKLPPIMEECSRLPQRKRRRKATDPPKELLVIPLLVRFENQKVTQGEKTNTDGNTKAVPGNNNQDYMSNKLQSQEVYKEEPTDSTLVKEIPTAVVERKLKTLQMDIDWNINPNPDGDFLPMPDAPSMSLLPPINGKKGPGNQSSMGNVKATNGTNNSTLSSKGQSLPTGIIRGSVPEELKECCKGGSVGSLIMSPNGEIVCLSLMGATRDTDMPIRFDFIAEEDVEDCLPMESAGQEEQWSGSQRDSEKEMEGSDSSSLQIPINLVEGTSSPKHSSELPKHKAKNRQRKISVPRTDIQEDADDVSDQHSVTVEIHKMTNKKREESKGNKKEVQSDETTESNTGTRREFRKLDASSADTSSTMNSQESLNNNVAFTLQDIDAVTESDLKNNGAINQSPRLVQRSPQLSPKGSVSLQEVAASLDESLISTDATGRYTPVKEEEVSTKQPIKTKDKIINKTPHTKSDTSAALTLEKVKATNERPSTGKSTLEKQEENIHNAEAPAPPTVQDEHSIKQDPNIKGTGKQTNTIEKDSDISKKNTPKESRKSKKIPEINKDVERETNENKETLPGLDQQAEATQQKSPPGKPQMSEEEEMVPVQEITNTANKETVKGKGKKKSKPEKAHKTEKSQAKATKKSNQGSATEGKAAFVVGLPKEKKAESEISYPKKSSGTRQQTIQETQEIPHEMPEEEEIDSEKESEDSYVVTEHVMRSPSPTEPEDMPPDSDTGATHNNSNQDAEQTAPETTLTTLPVTNPTNEEEYADSESSEATSSSVHQQKLARARDRSEKADRRRLEVERKRREREEQLRLEKEQQERMERMREELEEEQQRRGEEIRIRKKQEEEERQRQEQERVRRMQLEHQALERARLQQEEYRRKLQEIQKRKQEEELERLALERQRQQEQEHLEAEERMRLLDMAAEEREEYQRMKREREEQARQEAERQRLMAEAEAKALMEEAQRHAQLLARQTAALEKQLQFNRGLMKESVGMDQTQGVSRSWVFSYFELLELLGLPLPVEGELV
ncbi:uncharacterized protein KIAA2012 homolog isoform X2 [Rana temporaria]|uniref:uncharacterized protein KIAA2012 homolog isoform X2 n=1 Tax=Rana temporaria TaxID=8407 RepID=UPI001AAC91DC|nr:uncharacterized protein KIAA2012 homolog isoform X2 [Rana temporaria]